MLYHAIDNRFALLAVIPPAALVVGAIDARETQAVGRILL